MTGGRPAERPRGSAGPIAIGGVGGSGTRVVAELLAHAGWRLGSDLNAACDNLWFTLLFKRTEALTAPAADLRRWISMFVDRMVGAAPTAPAVIAELTACAGRNRPHHSQAWLEERVDRFLGDPPAAQVEPWGWKEPNTHVVADELLRQVDDLRYVHVTRHGLDMAYSTNHQQAELWGPAFCDRPYADTPAYRLSYWCEVTRRAHRLAEEFPGRVVLVNFDELCRIPGSSIEHLDRSLGITRPSDPPALGLVATPHDLGRWRGWGIDGLDSADVAFVDEAGFDTR